MWDLPGLGLKPMSPALAGGLLTPGPPGKSPQGAFLGDQLTNHFLIVFMNYPG